VPVDFPKRCVVGLGPVGSLVSHRLAGIGEPPVLVESHAQRRAQIAGQGILVCGSDPVVPSGCFADMTSAAAAHGPFEVVLLCVKANDLAATVPALVPGVADDGILVGLHNGLDTEPLLTASLGPSRVLRGVVNFAGVLEPDGCIRKTFFHPPNWLGGLDGHSGAAARDVAALLTRAGLETEAVDDIRPHVWRKVVHLAILAPLCALTRLDMRTALANREIRKTAQGLLTECIAVGDRLGYSCDNGFFERSMRYVLEAGDHPPSMLVDLLRGRPTEVAFINGKIVEFADRLGVPVPLNRAVAALLGAIDASAGSR
jgi:2-dehydropantoate 2-reductase